MHFRDITGQRYLDGDYLARNPSWDSEDSAWKARLVRELMAAHGVQPASIVDIGCGAGAVLAELRKSYPAARLTGFDIAPGAQGFWKEHAASAIEFRLGDFFEAAKAHYDVVLALDVLEHLQDPFDFLARLHGYAEHYVFHFPLDLSAFSVIREAPLLRVREKVGHLHYYTRGLALALLADCGYEVVASSYTGAAFSAPRRGWKTWLAAVPRRAINAINRDFGARLLGGETLMVLARARAGVKRKAS